MTQAADTKIVIRKTIPAKCEEVFDAWIDPAKMRQWFCDNDPEWDFEVDARVGGKFHIKMMWKGNAVPHDGEYRIVDRPSKLQFTWNSPFTGEGETLVTIELIDKGDVTDLVLVHEGLPEDSRESHKGGWGMFADQLAKWIK